jgi:UDP:flavonoid glycosyltransferase YjiC (YdhE family)
VDGNAGRWHKYLTTNSGGIAMKLTEIVDFEAQKRNIERMKQNAKRQMDQAKSASAWFKMQKAKDKEQKTRQKFIQAAQAASRSQHA